MKIFLYDIEIVKAIPQGEPLPGIAYCAGWHDHANMGISVIGAWTIESLPSMWAATFADCPALKFYSAPGFGEFRRDIKQADLIVGFNSVSFDDKVCAANGITVRTDYDILRECYKAKGLNPCPEMYTDDYNGYGLDALCKSTLHAAKTGNGELAPVWWQRNEKERVINYCLNDVRLTAQLFERIINDQPLIDPITGISLYLRNPLI